jgi:formylglycine-generating enzyme required for sulfatase activity
MSFRVLFRCVAHAIITEGLPGLLGRVPFGEVLYPVSKAVVAFAQERALREQQALQFLQQSITAPQATVEQEAVAAIEELRRYDPAIMGILKQPGVPQALRRYLVQVPMTVRATLRRLDDPGGVRLPLNFALNRAENYLAVLPVRLASHQVGERAADLVLTELLGVNGLGEVWKCHQRTNPNAPPVVLRYCEVPAVETALHQEVERIAPLAEEGWGGFVPYRRLLALNVSCLEYEHVEAGTLTELITGYLNGLGPIDRMACVTRLWMRLGQIVGALHTRRPALVHRNLKPANVLVRREKKGLVLRVTDLGISNTSAAWAMSESKRDEAQRADVFLARRQGAWTRLYASPQQKIGSPPAPQDDVYALGVIGYQMLVGDPGAALGTDFAARLIDRGVKRRAVDLITTLVSGDAGQRPKNAQEVVARLADLGKDQAASAAPAPAAPQTMVAVTGPRTMSAGSGPRTMGPGSGPPSQATNRPGGPRRGDIRLVELGDGVGLPLCYIPPGSFVMGSPPDEEGLDKDETPQHQVTFARGFYMGSCLITQAQWKIVMATKPSHFHADDRPVEMVSWEDCTTFCRVLREKTGERFRLPTEAEWEYACRAGSVTPFHFGETISAEQANYYAEDTYGDGQEGIYREQTTPVASFPSNAWGLFDMHGNVYEWCSDWYHPRTYSESEDTDPEGPRQGTQRVIRGGAWSEGPALCRAASRDKCAPGYRVALIGFRVVLVPRIDREKTAK